MSFKTDLLHHLYSYAIHIIYFFNVILVKCLGHIGWKKMATVISQCLTGLLEACLSADSHVGAFYRQYALQKKQPTKIIPPADLLAVTEDVFLVQPLCEATSGAPAF